MKKSCNHPAKNILLKSFFAFGIILITYSSYSQGVSISNNASNPPAAGTMLHVYGTTRIGAAGTDNGVLIFNNATNAKAVTISSGVTTGDYSLVLPPAQAAGVNFVLLNDGSGNLTWGPPTMGSEWQLLGNTGTNPAINYLGTADAQPLRLATSGTERIRINASATEVGIGMTAGANNTLDITNTTTAGKGINVTANSLTTGTILNLSGTSLTSGSAIVVNAGTTTGTVMDITANNLTTGSGLEVSSTSTGLTSTNCLGNFSLTGNSAGNTGTVLKVNNSGALNTGSAMVIDNSGIGSSFRVNDDGTSTDASPFIVDAAGNVGIGTETASSKVEVKNGNITLSNSGTAGELQFQGTSTGKTKIKAGAQGATDIPWVLPPTQGAAATLLTNDGNGNLAWGNLNSLGAATFQLSQGINYETSQTITSTTDVNVDGMVISVPAGTYMIWFSSDVLNGNNSNTCSVTIYTNGTAVAITERNFSGLVKKNMVSAMGVVTVTVTAPTEIRVKARVDANNATFYKRSLMGLKIG